MYFLDSCICIDFMRGRLPYMYDLLRKSDPRLFKISSVVEAKLLLGAEKSARSESNRLLVEQFLLPFEIVPFDSAAAREYATIRAQLESEGRVIEPNDMLIAATARSRNATLVTHNTKEFKRVAGLKLEEWAEMEL